MATKNTNVLFKKGLSANLQQLGSYNEGTFYLTTDTNRLYVGGSDSTLRELNRSIYIVEKKADLKQPQFLPSDGDFAFIKDIAALVVYYTSLDGSTGWHQINYNTDTDTNTDTKITSFSAGNASVDDDTKQINLELVLKTIEYNANTNEALSSEKETKTTIVLTPADLIAALNMSVENTFKKDERENYFTTTFKANSEEIGSIKVIAGNNVSLNAAGDNAYKIDVIADEIKTEYELRPQDDKPTALGLYMDSTEKKGSVELSGNNGITVKNANVTGDDGNVTQYKINFEHDTYNTADKVEITNADDVEYGESITVISKIELDNGHITNVMSKSITLPDSEVVTDIAVDKGHLTLYHESEQLATTGSDEEDPVFYYEINGKKYANQTELEVYDKDQIHTYVANQLIGLNAMVFKGAVDNITEETKFSSGDTYICTSDGKVEIAGNKECTAGDLLIATGVEDNDGYITNVTWTHIPAGDETVLTYSLQGNSTTKTVSLFQTGSQDVGSMKFSQGTDIEITLADVETDGVHSANVTVNHAAHNGTNTKVTNEEVLSAAGSLNIISNIEVTNGHIDKIETAELTLPEDTTYLLKGDVANNTVLLENQVIGNKIEGAFVIQGESDGAIEVSLADSSEGLEYPQSSFTIKHNKATIDEAEVSPTEKELKFGGDITIPVVAADAYGHITKIAPCTYTLPPETQYGIQANTSSENEVFIGLYTDETEMVKDALVNLKSETLNITKEDKNNITFDMVWGSF